MARGGRVLAPGRPDDPLQFIDVRDLADFLLRLVENDRPGTFNVTGSIVAFADLLEECRRVTASDAEIVWIPTDRLLAAGVDPWMGVPLWIAAPGWDAANRVPIDRALAAGLTFRPLVDLVRAALDDATPLSLEVGLAPSREAELLALR
jgi:2'-hydroxyisoflavone reductase